MKSHNNNKKEDSIISTILPSAILLIFIALMIWSIFGKVTGWQTNNERSSEDVWETAYKDVRAKMVGVDFEYIDTPIEDYIELKIASDNLIEKDNSDNIEMNEIKVNTQVYEDTYVDGKANFFSDNTIKMNETGPVYFQDFMLTRYINDSGKMKVLVMRLTKDENGETTAIERIKTKDIKELAMDLEVEDSDEYWGLNVISEKTYLKEIKYLIESVFTAKDNKEMKEVKDASNKYFSFEGRKTLFEGRQNIKLKDEMKIYTNFIQVGTSEPASNKKDRIFMQLEIVGDEQPIIVSIILKINNTGYIFDVDII